MEKKEAFDAAALMMTMFNAYVRTVGQEIGSEQAANLVTRTFEAVGVQQARQMKAQAGVSEFDAQTAFSLLSHVPTTLGIQMDIVEQGPSKVVAKSSNCPIYEASKAMGMDDQQIEALCRGGPAKFMATAAKQLNPALDYQVKLRSTPDGCCEEQIVMT
jgi:hypothetical protein